MASSQNLTPKIQWLGNDTLFCFNMQQAKVIAKYLEKGRYCDSLFAKCETEAQQLYQLQAINDSAAKVLTQKINNQDHLLGNQWLEIAEVSLKLEQSEKKLKSERWQKYLFLISSVALGTWLIVK